MDLFDFKENKIRDRQELLNKITVIFSDLKPVAIYQFGSGRQGYKDEFSDLDIWIAFRDVEIEKITRTQNKIFSRIAPSLVKHQSKSWSPPGGSATLIIHKTRFGLFQVDYYISKLTDTFRPESKLLYGKDVLKKDEWLLNKDTKEPHTLRKDVNLLLCLIFIGIKGIVRGWEGHEFENNIKLVHERLQNNYKMKIRKRKIKLSFNLTYKLLSDLSPISNKSQRRAIEEIRQYARSVESLYEGNKV